MHRQVRLSLSFDRAREIERERERERERESTSFIGNTARIFGSVILILFLFLANNLCTSSHLPPPSLSLFSCKCTCMPVSMHIHTHVTRTHACAWTHTHTHTCVHNVWTRMQKSDLCFLSCSFQQLFFFK